MFFVKITCKDTAFCGNTQEKAQFSLVTQRKQVRARIHQHHGHRAMADDILFGWTKEPIVQSVFAAGSEDNQAYPRPLPKGKGGICMEFFVDMETVAFGYALFVCDSLTRALDDGLNMRDDALGVALRLAAVVVRA